MTDSGGKVACGTPDAAFPSETLIVNSNAQAFYYGASDLSYFSTRVGNPQVVTSTYTITNGAFANVEASVTTRTLTQTITPTETFLINSKNESVSIPTTRPPGVTVTLDTPFVYQPASGATGLTPEGFGNCYYGTGTEGWGYPPQTLLDHMVKNSAISKQYPVSNP